MTKHYTVLAVDDETANLTIIEELLHGCRFHVECVSNGHDALSLLRQKPDRYDMILLDRTMPGMDGMTVLHSLKADPACAHIPVILQTAATSSAQTAEGLSAGAHYYLTKPYDAEMLIAVLDNAAAEIEKRRTLTEESYRDFFVPHSIMASHFRVSTLDELRKLALYLARLCPASTKSGYSYAELSYAFTELLTNALEHGNLALGYDDKTTLLSHGREAWEAELTRRMHASENTTKYIDIVYERHTHDVSVRITDQGAGFNWHPYMEIDPSRSDDKHGRGIAMANVIFDHLEFSNNGSSVTCCIYV